MKNLVAQTRTPCVVKQPEHRSPGGHLQSQLAPAGRGRPRRGSRPSVSASLPLVDERRHLSLADGLVPADQTFTKAPGEPRRGQRGVAYSDTQSVFRSKGSSVKDEAEPGFLHVVGGVYLWHVCYARLNLTRRLAVKSEHGKECRFLGRLLPGLGPFRGGPVLGDKPRRSVANKE